MISGIGWRAVFVAASQAIGEFDRRVCTHAQLAVRIGALLAGSAHFFKGLEQLVEVLRQEALSESRIAARTCDFVLGNQIPHRRGL